MSFKRNIDHLFLAFQLIEGSINTGGRTGSVDESATDQCRDLDERCKDRSIKVRSRGIHIGTVAESGPSGIAFEFESAVVAECGHISSQSGDIFIESGKNQS